MVEHLDQIGLLDIENFSAQGQNRLDIRIAPLLGGSGRRITLDQEQLSLFIRFGAAIREFPRQAAAFEDVLAAG